MNTSDCCCLKHPCCVTWTEYFECIKGQEPVCEDENPNPNIELKPYPKSEIDCFFTYEECEEAYKDKEIVSIIFYNKEICENNVDPPPELVEECKVPEYKLCPIYVCGQCGPYVADCEVVLKEDECPEFNPDDCVPQECCGNSDARCCDVLTIPHQCLGDFNGPWYKTIAVCRPKGNGPCVAPPAGAGCFSSSYELGVSDCPKCLEQNGESCPVGTLWQAFSPGYSGCVDGCNSPEAPTSNWQSGTVPIRPDNRRFNLCSGAQPPCPCVSCCDQAEFLENFSDPTYCCGSPPITFWSGPGCYCIKRVINANGSVGCHQYCPPGYFELCITTACPSAPDGCTEDICQNVGNFIGDCAPCDGGPADNPFGYTVIDSGCDCYYYGGFSCGGSGALPLVGDFTSGYIYDKDGNVVFDAIFITGYGERFL